MEAEKKCKYCLKEGVWWDEEHDCSNKPVKISEVLDNPDHPAYFDVKQMLEDLKSGKISFS